MKFSPEVLGRILFKELGVSRSRRLIVAYSGGCDSQVLLHGLSVLARAERNFAVVAAHFDHGLEDGSAGWLESCRHWAGLMGVEFVSESAGGRLVSCPNLEAASRELRYGWLARLGESGDTVMTAHHADDQAETFLGQVFRGADFPQLAGIHPSRPIVHRSTVRLVRPLLDFSRQEIEDYAIGNGLDWIEDPSNRRNDVNRNFLRNRLLPTLYARGRITRQRLVEGAEYCRKIAERDGRLLSEAVDGLIERSGRTLLCRTDPIHVPREGFEDQELLRRLVRFWLHASGRPSPTDRQLEVLFGQASGGSTGYAEISLKGERVRYFDRKFYLTGTVRLAMPDGTRSWKDGMRYLGENGIGMKWVDSEAGLDRRWLSGEADLKFAWHCGRKRIRLPGKSTSSMIRKIQQRNRVPPWERLMIPCILHRDRIGWAHGVGAASGYESQVPETGIKPIFSVVGSDSSESRLPVCPSIHSGWMEH